MVIFTIAKKINFKCDSKTIIAVDIGDQIVLINNYVSLWIKGTLTT